MDERLGVLMNAVTYQVLTIFVNIRIVNHCFQNILSYGQMIVIEWDWHTL